MNKLLTSYFKLHFTLLLRSVRSTGIPLALCGAVFFATLFGLWWYALEHVLEVFCISLLILFTALSPLGYSDRTDFLKTTFSTVPFLIIRGIENAVVALPIALSLFFAHQIVYAFGVMVFALLWALVKNKHTSTYVLPTPFRNHPFEFISGFRQTWFMLLLPLALVYLSRAHDNINFALFGLVLYYLVFMTYYQRQEPQYFVWSYMGRAQSFLWKKMVMVLLHSSMVVSLPFLLTIFYFPSAFFYCLAACLFGLSVLLTQLFAKYATFPHQATGAQAVYVGLCIWFPPMVLVIMPYLYMKAEKNLHPTL